MTQKNKISAQAKYSAKASAGARNISPLPKVRNPARRESCRLDLMKFLMTYKASSFGLSFSADHLESIKSAQEIILNGGRDAEAAPRGDGKTTRIEGAVEWSICYGHRKFIVPIFNNRELAEEFLNSIKIDFESNEKLMADFPEICYPVERLEGIALRANGQHINGERTKMTWKGKKLVFPTVKNSKSSGIIVQPKGILESYRGLKHKLATGETVRPDLFIIDDPQDDESANSPAQCDKRETLINKAVLGLAGPGKKISGFCRCTVIVKGDLADRLLDRKRNPEWQGRRYKMLYAFPESKDTLWKKYGEVRNEGLESGDKGKSGTDYYLQNQAAMDVGAVVAWVDRKEPGEVTAIQSAMNLYLNNREAFQSEYQNDPEEGGKTVYELRPPLICSRLNHLPRYAIPPEANWLVIFGDINFIGINYCAVAFKNEFTGFIIDYGKWPEGRKDYLVDESQAETTTGAQKISKGVLDFVGHIYRDKLYNRNGAKIQPNRILIDANFMTETIHNSVKALQRGRYPALCDRGRSSKQFKPASKDKIIGQPGNNYFIMRGNYGEEIVHNADYWRMIAQKAFLMEPGMPGSLSFWGDNPRAHEEFAYEVCSEKLIKYIPTENYWEWHRQPNQRNDKLDALTGCYVAAAFSGAAITGGERNWRKRKGRKENRKPKVQIEE